jgi:putative selenate reductase
VRLGRRIAVVGGGDVAMDCARTARRITGGKVEILYRRTVDQMPAHPEEIRDLLAEGITIRELVAPSRVRSGEHGGIAVDCAVMVLGEPDASGRPRPVESVGERISLEIDTLVVAIGQRADLGVFSGAAPATTSAGFVEADPETLESSISGVYVGGDLRAPGPSNIVDACGDGRRIARAILDRAGVTRQTPSLGDSPTGGSTDLLRRRSVRLPRVPTPRHQRSGGEPFDEVVATLDPEDAATEAARCLDCDLLCSTCDGVCPNRAIATYFLDPRPSCGASEDPVSLAASQSPQVAVLADLCNECGNCETFCPTAGTPWRDKPRVYFDRADFEAETDNAFMLFRIEGGCAIQGRFRGETKQLRRTPDGTLPADESDPDIVILHTLLDGLTRTQTHLPIPEANPAWLASEA